MSRVTRFLVSVVVALTVAPAPSFGADKDRVLVFAAASTTNALTEINRLFDGKAQASFGSSGTLARQVENGAPADVIVSANTRWTRYLDDQGLLAAGSRVPLVHNRLALVAPVDAPFEAEIALGFPLARLIGDGRLAIADPRHAPAGAYAEVALTKLGVWGAVAQRSARAANVRAALALVERGEATAGIVYTTDAALSRKVVTVGVFPRDSHPPIVYEAAIVAGRDRPAVKAYFDLLKSRKAMAVFSRYGFSPTVVP